MKRIGAMLLAGIAALVTSGGAHAASPPGVVVGTVTLSDGTHLTVRVSRTQGKVRGSVSMTESSGAVVRGTAVCLDSFSEGDDAVALVTSSTDSKTYPIGSYVDAEADTGRAHRVVFAIAGPVGGYVSEGGGTCDGSLTELQSGDVTAGTMIAY